jgi:Carboxypeptidase regulatory-like domain
MKKLIGVIAVYVLIVSPALPQSDTVTGQIRGRVVDSSGASIPQARLDVRNTATGIRASVSSDETGDYRFLFLPPGIYELKVEREGFVANVQKNVQVTIGQVVTVNFQLEPGGINVVVDVTETVPLTESERTQQSTTIDERYIRQLPIDRRDYLTYALLAPGIVNSNTLVNATDVRQRRRRRNTPDFKPGSCAGVSNQPR